MASNDTRNYPGDHVYEHYRSVGGADVGPFADDLKVLNCRGYDKIGVQVTNFAGSATITVYSWSDELAQFIAFIPAVAATASGAGVPFEFSVDCYGRKLFLAASEACELHVAGTVKTREHSYGSV